MVQEQGSCWAGNVNPFLSVVLADSAGSFATPPQASTSSCPPAQLVTVGKTLQLQISSAPTDLQAPILTEQQRCSLSTPCAKAHSPTWQQESS